MAAPITRGIYPGHAGGSSGGEGALIAAGGAAVGIGADIGGSIRFPAHFNGVIGFKSGMNQVPDDGLFPKLAHPFATKNARESALCPNPSPMPN